jgi:hypothetical protein
MRESPGENRSMSAPAIDLANVRKRTREGRKPSTTYP